MIPFQGMLYTGITQQKPAIKYKEPTSSVILEALQKTCSDNKKIVVENLHKTFIKRVTLTYPDMGICYLITAFSMVI